VFATLEDQPSCAVEWDEALCRVLRGGLHHGLKWRCLVLWSISSRSPTSQDLTNIRRKEWRIFTWRFFPSVKVKKLIVILTVIAKKKLNNAF